MIPGTLIAESIRIGAEIDGVRLATGNIRRLLSGDVTAGQPEVWTLIEFEFEADEDAADALAKALEPQGGWCTDFRTPAETFVVYSDRIFRYPGATRPRAKAAAYGRSEGVPEEQLDWPVTGRKGHGG